jgi:pullulanase-type alpha-1,6-glucosidase
MSPAPATAVPDLLRARAHWIAERAIVWPGAPAAARFALHVAPEGGLVLSPAGISGGVDVELAPEPTGLSSALRDRFPNLGGASVLLLPEGRAAEARTWLRGQVAVSARDSEGRLTDATGLQIPGVVDDMFAYGGRLGVDWSEGRPTLRLWAPTAREVRLRLFDVPRGAAARDVAMEADRATGVWSARGEPSWKGLYYLYEVEVYAPLVGRLVRNLVTDPYSVSLARNGSRSQILDLDDPAWKPTAWDGLAKPPLDAVEDSVLYELHVRDFSANDPSVPEALRGSFAAFALPDTHGVRHLRRLAAAGLTHVHLLPVFDFATVEEDRSLWARPEGDLESMPPDSDRQQAAVTAVALRDGFNWGYDPVHYTVPDGSYALDPDGGARVREFRELVAGLCRLGLRVVMDVVYNHTHASGQAPGSVLDRIVPGYYHRLDPNGEVEHSTCCENTASEHAMMEKLIVDSVVTWARAYKVDGFRFDLMGHHMRRNMLAVRSALDALTPERDGVDGRRIYVYGEGWDFGEVARDARGRNATQRNMAGTGIGTFNDRLRDAARGGSAFGPPTEQGFLTGLLDAPNPGETAPEGVRRERLLLLEDRIRVGLAGNLATTRFLDREGRSVLGREVDYNGAPTGYASTPRETVSYVEAHDNETLFDAIAWKAPPTLSMDARVRMQNLGSSLVALGQGIPFFHAGQELLRSKSLDRNSYDSGDWFNRLDFSYGTSNWGVGLPPARDNGERWPAMRPLLADPALRPGPAHIRRALGHLEELLRIRRSTRLLRLRGAEEVDRHLRFHNVGPGRIPGLIAFSLSDPEGRVDGAHRLVVVLLNALASTVSLRDGALAVPGLRLHPEQARSDDSVLRDARVRPESGELDVPGRTAVVFWTEAGGDR